LEVVAYSLPAGQAYTPLSGVPREAQSAPFCVFSFASNVKSRALQRSFALEKKNTARPAIIVSADELQAELLFRLQHAFALSKMNSAAAKVQ
jgi:hypothetical protein